MRTKIKLLKIFLLSFILLDKQISCEFNHKLQKDFSWFFYRSEKLIDKNSLFRDTRSFNGFNMIHFHRNSAGFFRTSSKCPTEAKTDDSSNKAHTVLSNINKMMSVLNFQLIVQPKHLV